MVDRVGVEPVEGAGIRHAFPSLNRGHVLGAAAVLVLPIAFYVPKGLAPLFAAAAIVTMGVHFLRMRTFPRVPRAPAYALGVFALWAALSAIWSLTPVDSLDATVSLALSLTGGVVLVAASWSISSREREFVEKALIAGGAFGFALLAVELVTDAAVYRWVLARVGLPVRSPVLVGPVFNFENGVSMTALFIWPWAMALKNRGLSLLAVVYPLIAVGLMAVAGKEAPLLAVALGAAVFAATLFGQRLTAWALAAVVSLGVLAAPLLPKPLPPIEEFVRSYPDLPLSAYSRIIIWKAAAARIDDRPLLGHGMDTSRALYGWEDKRERIFYDRDGQPVWWTGAMEPIPLHPHNAILQIWLELGALGAAIFALALVSILVAIAGCAATRTDKALCLAAFTTGLTIASVSYGIWQAWWLGALWLAAALSAAMARPSP